MKKLTVISLFLMLLCSMSVYAVPKLVGTFAQAGHSDWDPADQTLLMEVNTAGLYTKTMNLPAGDYRYKVVEGDTWSDPNYPGEDQTFTLAVATDMTFVCNDELNFVYHQAPIVAGDFISELGGTDWSSSDPIGAMTDLDGDYTFTWTGSIPEGVWQAKITLNGNWAQSTSANNYTLNVVGTDPVVINYNFLTNTVTSNAMANPTTQDVTVTFRVRMTGVDPTLYQNGVSVQGNVVPLDWNAGSNMLNAGDGFLYTGTVVFPTGSARSVEYKFAAKGADNNWTWQTINGNIAFIIDDSSPTMELPIAIFDPTPNSDDVATPDNVTVRNYPNPFNPETTIAFNLPKAEHVKIKIYNAQGRLVRNLFDGMGNAGQNQQIWDGTDNDGHQTGSGVFFYKLYHGTNVIGKKMVMMK